MPTSPDRKIKCPHCGWIRTVEAKAIEAASVTTVMRGAAETMADLASRIKVFLTDAQLTEANAWVDTKCPNSKCANVYQYNVRTGEVKK